MLSVFKKLYLKKMLCLTLATTLFCVPLTGTLKAQDQKSPIVDAMVTAAAIISASYAASYLQQRLANWWYYYGKKSETQEENTKKQLSELVESKEQVLPEAVEDIIKQLQDKKIPTQEDLQEIFDWFSTNMANPQDIINAVSNSENQKIIIELLNLFGNITSGNLIGVITNPTLLSLLPKIIEIMKNVVHGESELINNTVVQQLMDFIKKNIQAPDDILKIFENIEKYPKKSKKPLIKKETEIIKPKHEDHYVEDYCAPEVKQQSFKLKKGPYVQYKNDGTYYYKPLHSPQELAQMVAKIRSKSITAHDIDENTFWELVNYLQQYVTLDSNNEQDRYLLHQLGIVYRATELAQQKFKQQLAINGNVPASPETTSYIHNLLKEKGCPAWDVPVYQLNNDRSINTSEHYDAGVCGAYCIWIDEHDAHKKHNCNHESAHWFYQHTMRHFVDPNVRHVPKNYYGNPQIEYEADNFAYDLMPRHERMNLTKSFVSGKTKQAEPYLSNWLRIAREHGEMPTRSA